MHRAARLLPRRILGATVLLCLLHAAPGARADDDLVVADQKGQQKALLEAAGADQGLPYRIRWTEFEAAAPLLQALGAGAVDTGIAGDGPFLFAWGAGLPVRAALLIPPRGGGRATAVVAPAGSTIRTLSDLSGKRVATGRGSIGHLLLLRLIQTGAIPAPAPHIVFLAPAQAKAALDSGGIDAWSTWEPYVSLETIQNHGVVLADGAGVMPNNSFFVATDAALARKHAQLADFYRRVARAYAWGGLHQREYAALLARQTGLPQTVAEAVAQKLIATPAAVGETVVKAEQVTLEAYRSAGLLSSAGPFATAFDRSFTLP
ncbi:nitrate/sulfonate/bicarbonate ABC transporter periplasmic protein [Gluconacetobacter johannae DSM 13595]|uniref:Aliphatic sulfonate ABC transporter substrate-binding protein n=1 Tax=Gluconacetobacter johannae TaxID=112140 RepID=A0A7W4P4C7_9PROT|nr:aliphatic sulfonate ABC transporter substrate-binding protein [Gluconacetobacter johannae]MBB2174898.1 aliphatic sulfonate ABC transporter substrate-binding protein [Gluconacetobacter johannae]GBQ87699.1 nitrate/sulfonate/bicarbonate ABC transporter periplasmic protein [Gluconacetobacter johannae DSM 13595]